MGAGWAERDMSVGEANSGEEEEKQTWQVKPCAWSQGQTEQVAQTWKRVVQGKTGPGLPVEGAVGSVKGECTLPSGDSVD